MKKAQFAQIALKENQLLCQGDWTAQGIGPLGPQPLAKLALPKIIKINGAAINVLDTAGAWLLCSMMRWLQQKNISFELENFSPQQEKMLTLIKDHYKKEETPSTVAKRETLPVRVGKFSVMQYWKIVSWFAFMGEFFVVFAKTILRPSNIRIPSLFKVIEINGYYALPIIAFLTFLIGVVITYQIGLELRLYGANIYVVNFLGSAILREFGPLITAIIVIGRTGAAYTAQLGTMRVNQEIDALQTMGLSPVVLLVLPRILGLLIAMPLLTLWADIFGIMGGMLMAKSILDINYVNFLTRFPETVTLTTFMIGIGKSPVFAMLIAGVGCYQGMLATGSAESVGVQTTKSVVLAILLIIIADAAFSILFSWLNI